MKMYGKVNVKSTLNVRDGASADAKILGTLKDGETVIISPEYSKDNWYSIYYGFHGGFVSKDYVDPWIYGFVTASTLNVREGMSTNSKVLGTLKKDEVVKVSLKYSTPNSGWYSIYYGNKGGFVSSKYVNSILYGKVTAGKLNVRDGASVDAKILGTLDKDTVVKISYVNSKPDWYSIYYGDHGGFISKDYVVFLTESAEEPEMTGDALISAPLVNFVKSYEGFFPNPYYDCVGVRTIGYGSTTGWIMNMSHVTEAQATKALMEEINSMAVKLKANLDGKGIHLKQNEFDALASFAYNCGIAGLLGSTLYRNVCAGVRGETIRENFLAWSHGGGRTIQGLVNRRKEEYDIFAKGDYHRDL